MVFIWIARSTFETLAEYKMVKFLVQIALGCLLYRRGYCGSSHGCRDFGVSIITDMGEESIDTISHDEVLEAQKQNQKLEI
jgi:purine-nucleoside phosphorylase